MKGLKRFRLERSDREALIAAVAWAACAMGVLSLNDQFAALQMFWLPSAVAVGSIFAASPRRRTKAVLAIALGCMVTHLWSGFGLVASFGYTFANLVQALVVVFAARRFTRGRPLTGLNLKQMSGLSLAALGGSLLAVLLSWPFRAENDPAQLLWLVLSMTLGTAVGTPLLLYLRAWLKGRWPRRGIAGSRGAALRFCLTQSMLFALAMVVLRVGVVPLTPLMLASIVFAAATYGQLGASAGVFMFAVAATISSAGGAAPAAYLDLPRFEQGLVLQAFMLVMLATSLPLAALLSKYDRLALRLNMRNARLRESVMMLNLAEEVARIGRWKYDPRTGAQDWTQQMFRINGLDPDLGRDPGDIRALLPDGGKELFGELRNHAQDRATYSFEYRIRTPHGEERILKMYARNEYDPLGELDTMFGVVMDVTEHHLREEQLDKERNRAMRLAAEAQFLAQTDPLTGLANRRRTIAQLEKCLAESARRKALLAVIAFDVDHFKQVNDRFGHQVGDRVLERVADLSRDQVRASDLIGRTGGEEFIWLMPDAGAFEAMQAAERLRLAIEIGSGKGGLPPVTVSVGYALWRAGDSPESLLGRADTALYLAKQAGRNLVRRAA